MWEDLERVLIHETTILRRLDEVAAEITADYKDKELTVVAILNGSMMFMADLLRRIPLPLQLDSLRAASYHGGTATSGEVLVDTVRLPALTGRHVLVLDDILDSGLTLQAICGRLAEKNPLSIRSCVLLRKRRERLAEVDAHYAAFDIDDLFVVGYGLDYQERYRNLPCIGVLKPETISRSRSPA